MFDLAIKTTLESKTLAAYPLALAADFPLLRELGFAIFASFGKESNLVVSRRNQVFDFSPGIHCSAQSPGFGNERCSFRNLTIRS
ncbi:hypothetical protein GQ457_13G017060 [Hibiscus cannabinus]